MPTAHLAASAGQAGTGRRIDRLQVSYAATCPRSPESADTLLSEVRGAFWLRCPRYLHFLEKFQRAYAGLSEMVWPCSYSSSENQVEKGSVGESLHPQREDEKRYRKSDKGRGRVFPPLRSLRMATSPCTSRKRFSSFSAWANRSG